MMQLQIERENGLRKRMMLRCAVTVVVILALYLFAEFAKVKADSIKAAAALCIASCVLFIKPWFQKDRNGYETAAEALLFIGIILRIAYMLYTPWYVRVHDVDVPGLDGNGNGAYILHLAWNHRLPDSNQWQFYQQPLYYILSALFSTLLNGILGRPDEAKKVVEAAKTVSCIASCASVYAVDMLLDLCDYRGRRKFIALAFAVFLPSAIFAGGMICCDSLVLLMCLLMFIGTLLWYRTPDVRHTVRLALVCGLAVLTKISCAALALFTAVVMVVTFFRSHEKKAMAAKFALFGVISLPLGLWYSLRNYLRFGQSLFHVAEISTTNSLYCGNRSLVSRILTIDFQNLLSTPYADPRKLFNLPVYTVKSALFGEYKFDQVPIQLSTFMLILGCALAVCAVIGTIRHLVKGGSLTRQFALLTVCFMILSVAFFVRYPFGCSEDFRYYLIAGVFAALTLPRDPNDMKGGDVPALCLTAAFVPSCILFFLIV